MALTIIVLSICVVVCFYYVFIYLKNSKKEKKKDNKENTVMKNEVTEKPVCPAILNKEQYLSAVKENKNAEDILKPVKNEKDYIMAKPIIEKKDSATLKEKGDDTLDAKNVVNAILFGDLLNTKK